MPLSDAELDRAAASIRAGGLVAFPTETVYGLGANALNSEAVARIFEAKGRPWASPLIVHVADQNMARAVALEWPQTAAQLAAHFWPGPLTIVLKKAALIPDIVTANLDSVGIRIPSHPIALELIRRAGVPIAAPSANRFTGVSPTTAEHVRAALGDRAGMVLDAGPTAVGIESTVVSLHRHPPVLLRPGMITQAQLQHATGLHFEIEQDKPRLAESPGQHPRHYAPRTRLILLEEHTATPQGRGRILQMPREPAAFAQALYAELHKADGEGWDWIAIQAPPHAVEWAGIRDRLQRAATAPAD